jgi:hypothetical protein
MDDRLAEVARVGDYANVRAQSEKVRIAATEFRALPLKASSHPKTPCVVRRTFEQLIELEAILALRKRGQAKK